MLNNHINGDIVQFGGRTGSTRTTLKSSGAAQLYVDGLCALATNVVNVGATTGSDLFVTNTLNTTDLTSTNSTLTDLLVTGTTRVGTLTSTVITTGFLKVTGTVVADYGSFPSIGVVNLDSTYVTCATLNVYERFVAPYSEITSMSSSDLSVTGTIRAGAITTGSLSVSGSSDLQGITAGTLKASIITTGSLSVSGSSVLQDTTAGTLKATVVTTGSLSVSGSTVVQDITTGTLKATVITTGSLSVSGSTVVQGITAGTLKCSVITTGSLSVSGSSDIQGITAGTLKCSVITAGTLSVSGTSVLQTTSISSLVVTTFNPASVSTGTLSVSGTTNLQSATIANLQETRYHIMRRIEDSMYVYIGNAAAFLWGSGGSQSYSSGSFTFGTSNGRVSVPVSGIWTINAWWSGQAAFWGSICVNGTQTEDPLGTASPVTDGFRVVANTYQATATGGISISWTGYLSTTDFFYISFNSAIRDVWSTYPAGMSVSLISRC